MDEYEIGGATYTGDLKLDDGIKLRSTSPYVCLGWGGTGNGKGFGASFGLGVMFTDSPDITLRARWMSPAGWHGFSARSGARLPAPKARRIASCSRRASGGAGRGLP